MNEKDKYIAAAEKRIKDYAVACGFMLDDTLVGAIHVELKNMWEVGALQTAINTERIKQSRGEPSVLDKNEH